MDFKAVSQSLPSDRKNFRKENYWDRLTAMALGTWFQSILSWLAGFLCGLLLGTFQDIT